VLGSFNLHVIIILKLESFLQLESLELPELLETIAMMTRALGTGSAKTAPSAASKTRTDARSFIVSLRKEGESGRVPKDAAPALRMVWQT
jgi:hypothetical protein